MANAVRLHFSDGVEMLLDGTGERSILASALDSGINLLHQCHSGSCGTCIGRVTEGTVNSLAGRMSCLLPTEQASGLRLACLSVPDGDLRWELDYPSAMLNGPAPVNAEATVTGMRWLSETVAELTACLNAPDEFTFAAGQFVRLSVPGGAAPRCLSMASPPQELPALRFLIRYLADGMLSDYLKQRCQIGDLITLEGPYGSFVRTPQAHAEVFIAGGTGLAPILSMLDSMRLSGSARATQHLYFGVTRAADLFYLDELDLRRFWMPRLSVSVSVSENLDGTQRDHFPVHVGTVVDLLDEHALRTDGTAYLCGPPGMVAAATTRLSDLGYDASHIVSERFNPS